MIKLRRSIELPLMVLGGACVLAIMVLTAADVIARYLIAAPIRGAYEFVQALLAVATFAGLPLVGLRGEHISVRLIGSSRLGRLGRCIDVLFALIAAIVLVVLMQRIWALADLVGTNEQTLGAIAIPLEPLYRLLSVLAGISAVVIVAFVLPAHVLHQDASPGG
jgi:TRAP-type C4-dicarboxylate transport system permease small subunit